PDDHVGGELASGHGGQDGVVDERAVLPAAMPSEQAHGQDDQDGKEPGGSGEDPQGDDGDGNDGQQAALDDGGAVPGGPQVELDGLFPVDRSPRQDAGGDSPGGVASDLETVEVEHVAEGRRGGPPRATGRADDQAAGVLRRPDRVERGGMDSVTDRPSQ